MLEKQISSLEDELSEVRLEASRLKAELVSEKSGSHVKVSELQSRINEVMTNRDDIPSKGISNLVSKYFTFIVIAVGGRPIAHQRSFEDPRTEGANGISLAEGERRASEAAPGNGDVSEGFEANVIRGIGLITQPVMNETIQSIQIPYDSTRVLILTDRKGAQ